MDAPTLKPALPFTFEEHELSEGYSSVIYDANGTAVDTHLHRDVAEYVTRAVNAHDAMLAALQAVMRCARGEIERPLTQRSPWAEAERLIQVALDKAEGR